MPQTNFGVLLKLFSIAYESPTTTLADAVVSGTLSNEIKTAWMALGLPQNSIDEFSGRLELYVGQDEEEILHELRCEFTRLFLGDNPLIANSEGMWRMKSEGRSAVLIINSYSLEIADFMRECGIIKAEGYNDCIDYIDTEFDFASHLAERPQYLIDLGKDPIELLDSFIEEHMRLWIPGFCSEVKTVSNMIYYNALSELIDKLMIEMQDTSIR